MGWKQLTITIDDGYERIRDGVDLLLASASADDGVGLFSRTSVDRRHRILLLSPRAVEIAGDALSRRWVDCEAPELFDWDLVAGVAGVCERLGLARPRFGRRPPTPIVEFGRKPGQGSAQAGGPV
jgi:hypothetical protein